MKKSFLFLSVIIFVLLSSCPEKNPDSSAALNKLAGKSKEQEDWGTLLPRIPNNIGNTFTENPKTTRTITWQSTFEKGEVVIGGKHYPSTSALLSNYYHHKVVLNNLDPGKTYKYIAGTAGYYSPVYSFKTESGSSESFSVLHISDTHVTTSGLDADVWKQVIESAAGKFPNISFAVHTGDVADDLKVKAIPFYFDYAQKILADNAFIYSMGNNDSVDWYNMYFYTPDIEDGGILYYFNYGNALFINIDSNKKFTQTQLYRLESYLTNTTQKWKVIITHEADYGRSGSNTDLTKLFDKYNVNLVMAGHNHFYARSKPINTKGQEKEKGTVWSIPNTAGTKFNPIAEQDFLAVDEQPNLPMFSIFKFTKDNIFLEAYTVDGSGNAKLFDSYTFY